jgi:hypothetical protein
MPRQRKLKSAGQETRPSGVTQGGGPRPSPEKAPYYPGYFGTGEEEGVEAERELDEHKSDRPSEKGRRD